MFLCQSEASQGIFIKFAPDKLFLLEENTPAAHLTLNQNH